MNFLLDENASAGELANRLRAIGHGVERGNLPDRNRAPDEELLWLAKTHGWVLVTYDEDFQMLHRAFKITDAHAGILTLPARLLPPEEARILDIFAS